MTTLGDMLMGRAVTLPDGKVREPRRRAYDLAYIEKNREELYRKKRERYAANKGISAKRRAGYATADADKGKNMYSASGQRKTREDAPLSTRLLPQAAQGCTGETASTSRRGARRKTVARTWRR